MLFQIDPDKIADYFLVEICLWTVGQYCTGSFLVQCWPNQTERSFYRLLSRKKMTVCLSQHCTGNFLVECCLKQSLDNIAYRTTMTYSMSVYFIYYLPGRRKKTQNLQVPFQEKEYNWAIFYQIKEGICFNINQLIQKLLNLNK